MSHFAPDREPGQPGPYSPAGELTVALAAAEDGHMPAFDSEGVLRALGLDKEEPDGLTLMERFVGSLGPHSLRDAANLSWQARDLITRTNERTANPAQEALARTLGAVVSRQVLRETELCPAARDLALASSRKDLVPDEVRDRIHTHEAASKKQLSDYFEEMAETLSGLGGFVVIIATEGKQPGSDPDLDSKKRRRFGRRRNR